MTPERSLNTVSGADVVENPIDVGTGKDLSINDIDVPEKVSLDDYFGRQRRWLVGAGTTPTLMTRATLPLAAVLFVISVSYVHEMVDLTSTDLSKHDVLRIISVPGLGVSLSVLSLIVLELRRVLQPEGPLARLSAASGGELTLIRPEASARVKTFRRTLHVIRIPIVIVGALAFFAGAVMSIRAVAVGDKWWSFVMFIMLIGAWMLSTCQLILDFLFSMEVGAALAADAVADVIAAIPVSPVNSAEWEKNVVQPALGLPRSAMAELSDGWGKGLSLMYTGSWTLAIVVFAGALASANGSAKAAGGAQGVVTVAFYIFMDILILLLPLQVSRCVARVSDSCDELTNALNERRLDHLEDSDRLLALETALKNLHNEQGLGFTIADRTVLDRRKLRNLFFSVASVFGTLAPIIFSISVTTHSDPDNAAMYGGLTNSSSVYAISKYHRSYPESVEFCRSLWMDQGPASIGSKEENDALVRLVRKAGLSFGENFRTLDDVFIGASRRTNGIGNHECKSWPESCPAATDWQWDDGSPVRWFHNAIRPRHDLDADDFGHITLSVASPDCALDDAQCRTSEEHEWYYGDGDPVHGIGSWRIARSSDKRGVICKASSLESIRGATPVVYNVDPPVVGSVLDRADGPGRGPAALVAIVATLVASAAVVAVGGES
jgi:hypothetical protein